MPLIAQVAAPGVLVVAAAAVWRVTHLIWGEDGPWDVVVRLRRIAGNGFFGQMMDCFYCLSLWVAAPVAIAVGSDWAERALTWLGLSGAAILMERLTARGPDVSVRTGGETERHDAVLR